MLNSRFIHLLIMVVGLGIVIPLEYNLQSAVIISVGFGFVFSLLRLSIKNIVDSPSIIVYNKTNLSIRMENEAHGSKKSFY
ncbi:MAG TPA: hypothetical protein VJZ06_05535 [Mobilitalea sp.]|nr:hypothetical protein [Mobilitalea sp.]